MRRERMDEYLVEKGGRKSTQQRGMEEDPENGKESSHSAHATGMNERTTWSKILPQKLWVAQLQIKFPAFHETRSFITILCKILSLVVPTNSHPGMNKTRAGRSPWPLHFAGWKLIILGSQCGIYFMSHYGT
jgi:hypothetical protein